MRSFVEMTVDEEDAVDELDLPLSQQETKTSTRRADAMFSLMKQQERRLSRGEETILASPVRPTKRRHHRDSFNKESRYSYTAWAMERKSFLMNLIDLA